MAQVETIHSLAADNAKFKDPEVGTLVFDVVPLTHQVVVMDLSEKSVLPAFRSKLGEAVPSELLDSGVTVPISFTLKVRATS